MEEEVFNKDLGEIIRIGIFLPVPFRSPGFWRYRTSKYSREDSCYN